MVGRFSNLKITEKGTDKEVMSEGSENRILLDNNTDFLHLHLQLSMVCFIKKYWLVD